MDETCTKSNAQVSGTNEVQQYSSCFLVVGGQDSKRDCTKWNVTTKEHQSLPELSSDRMWSTSARTNNDVYVMGGNGLTKSCEKLNLTESKRWIGIADLPEARSAAASTVVQGQIYLSGGRGQHGVLSSCLVYDDVKDKWTKSYDMLQPRFGHGMCSVNSSIYCIAGYDGKQNLCGCERHDVRLKTSSTIASLNQARTSLACIETGGKIYAIGGWDDATLQTVEEYEPRINKWRNVPPLIFPRHSHSACVVDGRIYVVNGERLVGGTYEHHKSVEVYDPASDAWMHCFDLDKPVYGATAVGT